MAEKEEKNQLPAATDGNIVNIKDDMIEKRQKDEGVGKENEEEILKSIAEMFLAMSGNKEDRIERDEERKKKDRKLFGRNKKKMKKNKDKNKAEKKQKATMKVAEKDDHQATNPADAIIENKADEEEIEKSEKHTGCFGFIIACFVRRKEKKLQRDPAKSYEKAVIELQDSVTLGDADDLTGNGQEDVLTVEDIDIIVK